MLIVAHGSAGEGKGMILERQVLIRLQRQGQQLEQPRRGVID